jgi:hypothetical protein
LACDFASLHLLYISGGEKLEACLDGVSFSMTSKVHHLLIFFLSFFIVLSLKT